MDKVANLKKTRLNNSQPTSQKATFKSQSTNQRIGLKYSQQSIKSLNQLKTNTESNITNFYQQKKRIVSNDTLEENTTLVNRKLRKSSDIPITWATKNTNVDCQLKISIDSTSILNQQESSFSFKRNESKIDQMLNEFHAKLQFEGLSTNKEPKDSGINEFDEMLNDDSWLNNKDLNNALNELEKIIDKPNQSARNQNSKESGIGSLLDELSNNQTTAKLDLFKVPVTPKNLNKINSILNNSSVQFFSTPKTISKANKSNQCLNFENLSPIKGDSHLNSLINIQSDNKRLLNESVDDENLIVKKRNGRILFKLNDNSHEKAMNDKRNRRKEEEREEDDFDFIDDSFDMILSQFDDKQLLNKQQVINDKMEVEYNKQKEDDYGLIDESFDVILGQFDDKQLLSNKQLIKQNSFQKQKK